MISNFWSTLPSPFFVLAPLADVTDAAFRRIIATYGKPHVLWTEFTSAEGLFSPAKAILLRNLLYSEAERPIVAQLWGANPQLMSDAAALAASLGFDGIDLNMGCPDRRVEKNGGGAILSQHPERATALIHAAKAGANPLPVSVKIRIGYWHNEIETWLPTLLAAEPAAITIHARTRQELSNVPAHWDVIARAVAIRNAYGTSTLIIGNGDVGNLAEARLKAKTTGCDGIMLGRAIFGNPWLFNEQQPNSSVSPATYLRVLTEHITLFDHLLGDLKKIDCMKKHYKAYLANIAGSDSLRHALMETDTAEAATLHLRHAACSMTDM